MEKGFNLAEHVLGRADDLSDKPALDLLGQQVWSYSRLAAAVRGLATGLQGYGLKPGDRILMRLGNNPNFPITFLAAITAGFVPVPTSAALTTPEITAIAAEVAPKLIIADESIPLPDPLRCPVVNSQTLPGLFQQPPADFIPGDPDRPAYIIYTSGTSGCPRAVVHAHRAILARQMMFDGWYGLRDSDRLLHAGAFNWTYTLGTGLMDPWTIGATALIPPPGTAACDLSKFITGANATIFAAAPGVYRQMLRGLDRINAPALRHGLSAGEKLPEKTRAAWEDATGTSLHEAFGMSECSTFLSGSPARPAPPGTLGFPQPGRRIALLDDQGRQTAEGTIAIHKSDPGLMLGYLGQPDETAARYLGDWFLTGDRGRQAADGAITYAGRSDDMMNAGGFRVSPLEVEAKMATHPAIMDCAAVEVQVKSDASVIALFYTGQEVDADTLSSFASAHLARYKCPRLFVYRDSLPRGANGKLLRRALREN